MLIRRLSLNNFGLFKGRNEFDLRPKNNNCGMQPIILFGGKNGAGKTTFFDAIRIGLYGSDLKEFRFKKRKYERYIRNKFHQDVHSSLSSDNASIEIEFEYAHLGEKDIFKVSREWTLHKDELKESLSITKNGKRIDDIGSANFQGFINELIPQGISELFFFDGEKIQLLAENDQNNTSLKDSFKMLLGLNIIDKLISDLGVFINRKAKMSGEREIRDKITSYEKEKKSLDESLDIAYQERASINSKYYQIAGKIEEQETIIAREGGIYSERRDSMKREKDKLDHDIEMIRYHIRDLCSQLLPFSITPTYCQKLKDRLREEEKYTQWINTQQYMLNTIDDFSDTVRSQIDLNDVNISGDLRDKIVDRVLDLIRSQFKHHEKYYNFHPIHAISQRDTRKMLDWIEESQTNTPEKLISYLKELERLTSERERINTALRSAPEDDVIGPIIQNLNRLNKELGQYEEQIRQLDDKIRSIEFKKSEVTRQLESCYHDLYHLDKVSNQVAIANKVRIIAQEYSQELQSAKIEEFEEIFLSCFNHLIRKDDYITDVDIDIDTFTLTLHSGNRVIPQSNLSVGEKQIYAVAMLWAMAIASRRPLPFIIDTPLGRLDSEHRGKIVSGFFPNASHQTIIFSTDTEIDLRYFKELRQHIARSYHLDFVQREGSTRTTEGYFWNDIAEVEN